MTSFVHLLISKYLLIYYVPDSVLGAGNTGENKPDENSVSSEAGFEQVQRVSALGFAAQAALLQPRQLHGAQCRSRHRQHILKQRGCVTVPLITCTEGVPFNAHIS